MSTITVPEEISEQEVPGVVAEAQKDSEQSLFRWNAWIHVGAGAAECQNGTDGSCSDPAHFHAWCRLPNPWQFRDITEKATAARARYRKMLRDPDSDQAVALEDELEELSYMPEDVLIEELVDKHFPEDYAAAVRAVDAMEDEDWEPEEDEDEEDRPKRFAHIDQDREEYRRQQELPEDQRSADYPTLEKNIADYGRAVEQEMDRLMQPRRDALKGLSKEELISQIRPGRIEEKVTEVYLHWHAAWTWLSCTYKPRKNGTPNEAVWKDIHTMRQQAPPEVVEVLRATFDGLEGNLAASRRGKDS